MKTNKTKFIIIMILIVIGIIFSMWGAIEYLNYPGMRELRKAALKPVYFQYGVGIGSLIIAYVLTYKWKK